MNQVLDNAVRHPSELFKGRQVLELGFNKIRYLDNVDVLDFMLSKGAIIPGSLLNGAKIIFKSGLC